MRRTARDQRGYNIVEVMIAMAILGSVMLSIIALFYLGRRNVYSGKQLTYANAVGVQVMEDLSALDMLSLYAAFDITTANAATTLNATKTVNGITYAKCVYRSTAAANLASDVTPPGFLTRWNTTLGNGNRLQDPLLEIIMVPTLPANQLFTTTTPARPSPSIMKIRVVISWKEGQRTRSITLDTIKTQRS